MKKQKKSKLKNFGSNALITLIIAFVLFLIASWVFSLPGYINKHDVTVIVQDKNIKTIASGKSTSSFYLVYTDKGTFKITDQLFYGKFNSSDIYGQIDAHKTYVFTVSGLRIPIFSMYQNVVKVKKLNPGS